jgi:GNAT superfamily N-acetyltransferase
MSFATISTTRNILSKVTHSIGAAVSVRPIIPSDADNYRDILQRMSVEDRYCRFFHVVDHFDDNAIDRYVKARPDAIGLIAEQHGRPLGVAHAFFIDEGHAEIAMVVANDARHLGVGQLLFDRLISALQHRRCTSVIAYALARNVAVTNLARSVGMQPESCDGGIVTWTLSPAEIPPAESAHEVHGDVETRRALLQQALQAAPIFFVPYLYLLLRARVGVSLLSVLIHTRANAHRLTPHQPS